MLGEYQTKRDKVRLKHLLCGSTFEIFPDNFIRKKQKCNYCAIRTKRTTTSFQQEVKDLVGNEYTVHSEYITIGEKVLLRHAECGNEFWVSASNFLHNGSRCPHCYGTPRKTTEDFKQEVRDVYGDEIKVLSEYLSRKEKIWVKHTACGHKWEARPNDFIKGQFCPKCRQPRGEKRIHEVLLKYGYSFQKQYKLNDCRNINPLPFDFAVFDGEGIFCLIEYDGIQHFKPVDFFGGEAGFRDRCLNDSIKTSYCIEAKIPLVRVAYTELSEVEAIILSRFRYIRESRGGKDGTVSIA